MCHCKMQNISDFYSCFYLMVFKRYRVGYYEQLNLHDDCLFYLFVKRCWVCCYLVLYLDSGEFVRRLLLLVESIVWQDAYNTSEYVRLIEKKAVDI